jgi:hypothetical protein
MRLRDESRTHYGAKSQGAIEHVIIAIGPYFHLVRTFDLAPILGRAALVGRFPGLKPWAETSSPFGAQISGRDLL